MWYLLVWYIVKYKNIPYIDIHTKFCSVSNIRSEDTDEKSEACHTYILTYIVTDYPSHRVSNKLFKKYIFIMYQYKVYSISWILFSIFKKLRENTFISYSLQNRIDIRFDIFSYKIFSPSEDRFKEFKRIKTSISAMYLSIF